MYDTHSVQALRPAPDEGDATRRDATFTQEDKTNRLKSWVNDERDKIFENDSTYVRPFAGFSSRAAQVLLDSWKENEIYITPKL